MNAFRTPAAPSGISAYIGYLPYIVAALVEIGRAHV